MEIESIPSHEHLKGHRRIQLGWKEAGSFTKTLSWDWLPQGIDNELWSLSPRTHSLKASPVQTKNYKLLGDLWGMNVGGSVNLLLHTTHVLTTHSHNKMALTFTSSSPVQVRVEVQWPGRVREMLLSLLHTLYLFYGWRIAGPDPWPFVGPLCATTMVQREIRATLR